MLSASSPKIYITKHPADLDDNIHRSPITQIDQHTSQLHTMPAPKRVYVQKASAIEPKGTVQSTFEALTSAENRAVVTSIAAFVVWLTSPELY
jgi:hypothetical protein